MKKIVVLLVFFLLLFSDLAYSEKSPVTVGGETLVFNGEAVFSAVSSKSNFKLDDGDIGYESQLRLGIGAIFFENMAFSGQVYASKALGAQGDFSVASDRTSSDSLYVNRVYLKWLEIAESGFHVVAGRRPFFIGAPSDIFNGDLYLDTRYRNQADFNVDGVEVGYDLSSIVDIEGMNISVCYGKGFDSELGNGARTERNVLADADLLGVNFNLFNDGQTFVQLSLFRAADIVDASSTFSFPEMFAPHMYEEVGQFSNMNFNVRYTPSTVIGDINLASLSFTREEDNGFVWFGSVGWTQLDSNGKGSMFGGLGKDQTYIPVVDSSGIVTGFEPIVEDESNNGYGVYIGIRIPVPMGKLGIEYNYGSKYWTPITQNQNDLFGSKLQTRGHVGEIYYIFDFNSHASIKVGGLYHDYEYTGSGSLVGEPKKIDDIKNGTAYTMMPVVVEYVSEGYLQLVVRF